MLSQYLFLYQKRLLFFLSMLSTQLLSSQVIVEGVNYTSGTYNYCSPTSIISPNVATSLVNFSNTADVQYTATTYILLQPGFKAGAFATSGSFTALIGTCPITVFNGYYGSTSANNCTYSVTAIIQEKNGSLSNTLTMTYSIPLGVAKDYVFTTTPGYQLDFSTLHFTAQTGACSFNFGLTDATPTGNCASCTISYQVTQWRNMSAGRNNYFEICAQTAVGKQNNDASAAEANLLNSSSGTNEDNNATDTKSMQRVSVNSNMSRVLADFQVYPNPSEGVFTLSTQTEIEKSIFVYDISGRIIFQKINSTQAKFEIDISTYSKGIYLIRLTSGNETWSKKIISE